MINWRDNKSRTEEMSRIYETYRLNINTTSAITLHSSPLTPAVLSPWGGGHITRDESCYGEPSFTSMFVSHCRIRPAFMSESSVAMVIRLFEELSLEFATEKRLICS